eukprot:scpid3709/ scgid32340/ Talin-1
MADISLKINIPTLGVVKTLSFSPSLMVLDVCKQIRERVADAASVGLPKDTGLFRPNDDPKKAQWLDNARTLDFYTLRSGDLLDYVKKTRPLRVKMMDGSLKTVLIDDSATVEDLVKTICERVGISNANEYSLLDEETDQEKAEASKRRGSVSGVMDGDVMLRWLQPEKSLREQNIKESTVLTLRLKFWNRQIDQNDPVQLNLLCAEARSAILTGAHPITEGEAIQFAALQAQETFGNFDPAKNKTLAYSDLGPFLPREYGKNRAINDKVIAEFQKLTGLTDINAKLRYVRLFRSLKTYGVSFFHVKEKVKGKNRLTPRLLGVSRENVMRLDEKTKEVLKTWPLVTVRRWAASPNSFTLDFGDYAESYYSVQTSEGEAISQLLAGYIDIVLKRTKAQNLPGGGGQAADISDPAKAAPAPVPQVQHMPGGMQLGQMMPRTMSISQPVSHTASAAQTALSKSINNTLALIASVSPDLNSAADLPPIGSDPSSVQWKQNQIDVLRQNASSQVTAIAASAAQIIRRTSGDDDDTNYTAVGSSVTTISSNFTELTKGVRTLAALLADTGDSKKMLQSAKDLAASTQKLLNAVLPEQNASRQVLLGAAGDTGIASGEVLKAIGEQLANSEFQEQLLTLAKEVANSTQALVQHVKEVAQKCEDKTLKAELVTSTKRTATSTSQLVACTKTLSSCVTSHIAQEQMNEAALAVAAAVDAIFSATQKSCHDEKQLSAIGSAATAVTAAIDSVMNKLREGPQTTGSGEGKSSTQHEDLIDSVMDSIEQLFSSLGRPADMVKQARQLATASSRLVTGLRDEAKALSADPQKQKQVLGSAKKLADSTAKMVECAKGAATHANDEVYQTGLKKATEDLRSVVDEAFGSVLRKKAIAKLQNVAKQTASGATQLIAAAQGAGASNRNTASQQQLAAHGKEVASSVGALVQSIRFVNGNPDGASAQLGLIHSCQQLAQPTSRLVAACKAAVPTIGDSAAALQLSNFSKSLSALLVDLSTSAKAALQTCGSLELDSAADNVRQLSKDIEAVLKVVKSGKLLPLPGETLESASLELGISTKTFGSSMAQLLTAASQGKENYTGVAARDVANALKVVYTAGRGVAAGFQDQRQAQEAIMQACSGLMDQSLKLLLAAKDALLNPGTPQPKAQLALSAKNVQQSLGVMFGCLPSVRDVDAFIQAIAKAAQKLSGKLPKPSDSYQKLQLTLNENGASLNASASHLVVSSKGGSSMLAKAAKKFTDDAMLVFDAALAIAGATKSKDDQKLIIDAAMALANSSGKFLVAGKQLAAHPEALNAKNQLNVESRNVTDSINTLLGKCVSTTPGQKECENVLRSIEGSGSILETISEPVTDLTFLECQQTVQAKATTLGATMGVVPAHIKKREFDKFGDSITEAAECISSLLEAAAQAAYLIGVSDPTSIASQPGLVDSTQTAQAQQAIQNACDTLLNPASRNQQILAAATTIAKHTAALCNSCKSASQRTRNEVARHNFVQSAKDIAEATGQLVKAIKSLAGGLTDQNREVCKKSTIPLLESIDKFVVFSASPEFASVAAKISKSAQLNMKPIIEAAKAVLSTSVSFVNAAKSLCGNADDAASWQLLAMHSKTVTEAVKRLLEEIVSKAPGQHECETAIQSIVKLMNEIDQSTLGAISNTLQPRAESTLEGFRERSVSALNGIQDTVRSVVQAATSDPTKLGHTVSLISSYCDPLVSGLVGAASRTKDSTRQMLILNQAKTLVECLLELLTVGKKAGGNSSATSANAEVVQAGKAVQLSSGELITTVQAGMASHGVEGPIATIRQVMDRLDDALALDPDKSFLEYQESLVRTTRSIATTSQVILGKASTEPEKIAPLLTDITNHFGALGGEARNALAACEQADVAARIQKSSKALGESIGQLISNAGAVMDNPSDSFYKLELGSAAKAVSQQVSFMLAALQAGSRGTQACLESIMVLSGVTGDLETTCMFADAGTLTPLGPTDTFSDHRDILMSNAKTLVEDTKKLVASAAGTQEQLAAAAESIVVTVQGIANAAKDGAAAIGPDDKEAQVMVLNSAKDVSQALSSLLLATKNASGKSVADPEMEELKTCAKVMIGSVSSLIKTVKISDDEAARGGRGMETAIEAVNQELQIFTSSEAPQRESTPEDLIHATKAITMTTARAIAAANSGKQSDVLNVAQLARKAVAELLATAKAAAAAAENDQHAEQVRASAQACVKALLLVMDSVLMITTKQNYEKKQKLPELSKAVAVAVSDVIQSAEVLKGTDWVNPDDPNVQAENELLAAASAIEAAAKKLTALRKREDAQEADPSLNFHEQIVEAARAITAATGALVKSATQAQRELVASGAMQVSDGGYGGDEFQQWSQGLVSAAKTVAATTNALCEAANAAVDGGASEERLIASSKAVAKATAQLLVACMIKADPTGSSMKRLQEAGQAVKAASENLVKAAKQAMEAAMDEEVPINVSERHVGGMAQEIEAMEQLQMKEKELELAKRQLHRIRQDRYKVN